VWDSRWAVDAETLAACSRRRLTMQFMHLAMSGQSANPAVTSAAPQTCATDGQHFHQGRKLHNRVQPLSSSAPLNFLWSVALYGMHDSSGSPNLAM
jgi:hypothetical protein